MNLKSFFINKNNKKILFFILLFFLISLFILPSSIFATRDLEIDYPEADFSTTAVPLNKYIAYIFQFIVGVASGIALLFLVLGGLHYLSSAGNPAEMKNAKTKIFSALFGLIIILGSWIILGNINPILIDLQNPDTSPIDPITALNIDNNPIWFCSEEIPNINQVINESININIRKAISNEIRSKCITIVGGAINNDFWRNPNVVYIFPGPATSTPATSTPEYNKHYGVILHSINYRESQVVYNLTDQVKKIIPMNQASSTATGTCDWYCTSGTTEWIQGITTCGDGYVCPEPNFECSPSTPITIDCLPPDKRIFFTEPFTMVRYGKYSYSFRRMVKLYKYHDTENLFENREIDKKEKDGDITPEFYSKIYLTGFGIGEPLKIFPWYSFKIVGSLKHARPYEYSQKTIIIFFPPVATTEGRPIWENGESSKIVVLTENSSQKNINLNTTNLKKWGEWKMGDTHDPYDCKDTDAPIPCGSCDWYWNSSDPADEKWELSVDNCESHCGGCVAPSFQGGGSIINTTTQCSVCGDCKLKWENNKWVVIEDNCSINDSCGGCSIPTYTGVIGDTETTDCTEEEQEEPFLPCAGGMIIIAGEFGIR